MKITKRVMAIILSLVLLIVAVGCTESTTTTSDETSASTETASVDSNTDSNEPVTLRFSWWGGDARHEGTLASVEYYMEQNPHITIECEYSGWDGYYQKLTTQLAGGTAPDIMQVNANWIDTLREQDKFFTDPRDISDIIDLSGFSEAALLTCDVAGELQGLPSGQSVETAIVNVDFFEEHNLNYEEVGYWTWDKLIEEGKRVNSENPDHYLLNEFPNTGILKMYLEQQGLYIVNPDFEIGVTEEELAQGFQLILDLIDNNVMLPYEQSAIYADKTEQFPKWLNGEMGMFIQVASVIPSLEGGEFELAVTAPPMMENAQSSGFAIYPTNIISINENSEYKTQAAEFVDYFFNDPKSIELLGDVRGVPPTSTALEQLSTAGTLNPLIKKSIEIAEEYPGWTDSLADYNTDIATVTKDYVEQVGYRELTPQQAATELIAELQEICDAVKAE